MTMTLEGARERARELDEADELARFRDQFVVADPRQVYLDGNSLGRLPKATAERLEHAIGREWGEALIGGWNGGWWELPERLGNLIAGLIGARGGEVIVADSTSVNLFKLLAGYLAGCDGRRRVIIDNTNFPTDCYIAQGVAGMLHPAPELVRVDLEGAGDEPVPAALREALAGGAEVVLLSHVAFKSGYRFDLRAVNDAAAAAGAVVIWDFSHSAGAVPIEVHAEGVRLAVGCTYKYLNGGPGAPAYLFVAEDLQERVGNPIPGWFGQADPFAMRLDYEPVRGIRRFLTGSTPILSMQAIEPAVEILLEAGMERLWEKSRSLITLFRELVETELAPQGFAIATPEFRNGSHVSISHEHAWPITPALIAANVTPDFRAPNLVRFGFAPVYNTHAEVVEAVARLVTIMKEERWHAYLKETDKVVT